MDVALLLPPPLPPAVAFALAPAADAVAAATTAIVATDAQLLQLLFLPRSPPYLSPSLTLPQSPSLPVSISVSVSLPSCLPLCLHLSPSVCLSVCLPLCLPLSPSFFHSSNRSSGVSVACPSLAGQRGGPSSQHLSRDTELGSCETRYAVTALRAMRYHATLDRTALQHLTLRYNAVHAYFTPHCTTQHRTAPHHAALPCNMLCRTTPYYTRQYQNGPDQTSKCHSFYEAPRLSPMFCGKLCARQCRAPRGRSCHACRCRTGACAGGASRS